MANPQPPWWSDHLPDVLSASALALGFAVIRLGEWPLGVALVVIAALYVGINHLERDEEVRRRVRRMEEEQARASERGDRES